MVSSRVDGFSDGSQYISTRTSFGDAALKSRWRSEANLPLVDATHDVRIFGEPDGLVGD